MIRAYRFKTFVDLSSTVTEDQHQGSPRHRGIQRQNCLSTKRAHMKRLCTAFMAAAGCMPALAVSLQCSENKVTNAMQCVAPAEVRPTSIENVRSAPLYMGGPNNVRKTAFTVHTNCKTGVTHLKDRDGVSFGGGDGNETKAIRELRAIVCEAQMGKRK